MKRQYPLLVAMLLISSIGFTQRTISLNRAQELIEARDNNDDFDVDALDAIRYVKDVDNRLEQFVGKWTGTYGDKTYNILFIKKTAINISGMSDGIKWDRLVGFISVEADSGVIYTNNRTQRVGQPPQPYPTNFFGTYFQKNSNVYIMSFVGRCYNEAGDVFIKLSKDNPEKMILTFSITPDLQAKDCPDGFDPLFPVAPQTMALVRLKERSDPVKSPTSKPRR